MKSLKILLPTALTFAMFLGSDTIMAQGLSTTKKDIKKFEITLPDFAKKSIGLNYKTTLAQINQTLTSKIKSNRAIEYKGKVIINFNLYETGKVDDINFDQKLPSNLKENITSALQNESFKPVTLNGKSKVQSFSIPLIIK